MHQPYVPGSPFYRALKTVFRISTSVLFDLKAYGLEHVPSTGGVLLLSNHQSFLDPPCVTVALRRPASFLAKSELFENPAFSWFIRQLNAFPVRQGAGDVGAVRETIRRLKEGHVITVFPEGTRADGSDMLPLQGGFALIVRKAGVPIIPVAVDGTGRALPKDAIALRPTPVRVQFGPPMDVAHLKPAQIVRAVDRELHRLLAEVRRRARDEHATSVVPTAAEPTF